MNRRTDQRKTQTKGCSASARKFLGVCAERKGWRRTQVRLELRNWLRAKYLQEAEQVSGQAPGVEADQLFAPHGEPTDGAVLLADRLGLHNPVRTKTKKEKKKPPTAAERSAANLIRAYDYFVEHGAAGRPSAKRQGPPITALLAQFAREVLEYGDCRNDEFEDEFSGQFLNFLEMFGEYHYRQRRALEWDDIRFVHILHG